MKIDTNLPIEVLAALASACGFHARYDRSPGVDAWTISHGHGASHVEHTGTRQEVCAFLIGYADMRMIATQILNEIEQADRALVTRMRERLGPR